MQQLFDLHVAATAPAAAVMAALDLAGLAMNPEEANEGRDEPEEGGEEGEGDDGLELAARITSQSDIAPVEDGTAGTRFELLKGRGHSVSLHLFHNPITDFSHHRKLTSTRRPKAAHQHRLMTTSKGQLVRVWEVGISQMRAKKMEMPATTSA